MGAHICFLLFARITIMTKTGINAKKTIMAVSTAIFLKLRVTFMFDKDASIYVVRFGGPCLL
jgi:hypothetical protein